ncbi:TD and POZ domain-containing protein 5 [Araneus ventricosus]|uniref:TD and POZ domain-containing protein 5 n=1 Tax=Araneus ventricosus TaxID=182803 RepID=A0A4Y2I9S9_ARAVE|nr:TD and POZ domain-containing protein 5 [Araneus ventricosus]
MATKTDDDANGCIFLWKIENISRCYLKMKQEIIRPIFIADALEGTKWSLWLYPMGDTDENYVDCYLYRERDCSGPNVIEIGCELAILDKDGSFLTERIRSKFSLKKGQYIGFQKYVERKRVFVTEREAFLPDDSLTVQCTIWRKDETPIKTKKLSARTVFKVNQRSFVWRIDEFSTLKPGFRNKFKDDLIDFDLVLDEILDLVKKLDIDIISFHENIKYFSFKISIINSKGEKEECGKHEYFVNDLKKGILSTPLFSKMLMENRTRYLQNDALLLDCEYISSNGTVLYELLSCGITSPKVTKVVAENETSQQAPVLANDLKSVYNDGIFSDTELRTPTQTFPAHKIILTARSPVFRRMFSNDMKENSSGHVDITDLEADTIHRMLVYIYTDTLEDLQLENACKLYIAADKYEILSLKNKCSSFLKENLCPTKVCDVLLLADLHQDNDLKSFVKDYILKYDKDVFQSQVWKDFMDSNLKLAADIMYRRVFSG